MIVTNIARALIVIMILHLINSSTFNSTKKVFNMNAHIIPHARNKFGVIPKIPFLFIYFGEISRT